MQLKCFLILTGARMTIYLTIIALPKDLKLEVYSIGEKYLSRRVTYQMNFYMSELLCAYPFLAHNEFCP
jgi:hypothetical protein